MSDPLEVIHITEDGRHFEYLPNYDRHVTVNCGKSIVFPSRSYSLKVELSDPRLCKTCLDRFRCSHCGQERKDRHLNAWFVPEPVTVSAQT